MGRSPILSRISDVTGGAIVLVVTAALTLRVPIVREFVTVVASRTPHAVQEAPAPVYVLDSREIRRTSAPALDAALSRVPSFSLFRRSSSLASHPTTHGVSLRGIGASGASRTLVLVDGVPENDGFGNWVHWSTLPLLQVDHVELTGSGLSTLYGSSALAGAICRRHASPAGRGARSARHRGHARVLRGRRVWRPRGGAVADLRRRTAVSNEWLHRGRARGARAR